MRCCWLLAMGLMIGPVCLRDATAQESVVNVLRQTGSGKVEGGDEAQATLAALSVAVRMPPVRRPATKSTSAVAGRPAPIVRLAKPSPYAAAKPTNDETSLDELATRLVSHSETAIEPVAVISEEAPELNRPIVRPAAVWTPTEVGNVEDDSSAPVAQPVVSVVPAEMPIASVEIPISLADKPIALAAEKPAIATQKKESSRAVVRSAANPLRQASTSTILSHGLDNPLR